MRKKILFVVNVDWFFISHRLPLALEALKRGYEVHIACGITDKKEYLESLGLIVHPLNLSRSGTGIKAEIKAFCEIYNLLAALIKLSSSATIIKYFKCRNSIAKTLDYRL